MVNKRDPKLWYCKGKSPLSDPTNKKVGSTYNFRDLTSVLYSLYLRHYGLHPQDESFGRSRYILQTSFSSIYHSCISI